MESHKSYGEPKKFGPSHFHSFTLWWCIPSSLRWSGKEAFQLEKQGAPLASLASHFMFILLIFHFYFLFHNFHSALIPQQPILHINTLTPDFFPSCHFLSHTYSSFFLFYTFPRHSKFLFFLSQKGPPVPWHQITAKNADHPRPISGIILTSP